MARMWLLQSGIVEKSKVVFLYDNQAAALAVIGKVVSRTNCTLCKVGIAIDRLCNKLYCTSTHHIHSHDNHPWNELTDAICTFVTKKPQESKVKWTPISPLDNEIGYCLDIASCMYNDFVSRSLSKDDDIGFTCQML